MHIKRLLLSVLVVALVLSTSTEARRRHKNKSHSTDSGHSSSGGNHHTNDGNKHKTKTSEDHHNTGGNDHKTVVSGDHVSDHTSGDNYARQPAYNPNYPNTNNLNTNNPNPNYPTNNGGNAQPVYVVNNQHQNTQSSDNGMYLKGFVFKKSVNLFLKNFQMISLKDFQKVWQQLDEQLDVKKLQQLHQLHQNLVLRVRQR